MINYEVYFIKINVHFFSFFIPFSFLLTFCIVYILILPHLGLLNNPKSIVELVL